MNDINYEYDLVVLVADKNMKSTFEGLLGRTAALGIRNISSLIYTHPERDPGCLSQSDVFLRPFCRRAAHAIVVFDHDGCGRESESREELENRVGKILSLSGWEDRASVIVIDPELENWVFSDSPEVEKALGWKDYTFRTWLEQQNLISPGEIKPWFSVNY